MIKKIALLALSITAILGAFPQPQAAPEHPVAGGKVIWTVDTMYRPSDAPEMIVAVTAQDTAFAEVLKGVRAGEAWSFTLTVPKTARFLEFKIEDDQGPLADDGGGFFGLPVYDNAGAPLYDAYRDWANLNVGLDSAHDARAMELLREELGRYPANWPAFVLLRQLEVKTGQRKEADVAAEFDSLLAGNPQSPEALSFAALEFFFGTKDLQPRGVELMATCAEKYPSSRYWAWEQYTIYAYISQEPTRLGAFESEILPQLKGYALETAYIMVMTYAMSASPKAKRVEDLTNSFLKEFPSSPMAAAFILSTLRVKYQQPNAQWAEELEGWLKRYRSNPELNLALADYYGDRNWNEAVAYYKRALKTAQNPQAAITFAEAAATKGKNMDEASKALSDAEKFTTADYYRRLAWWQTFKQRNKQLAETQARLYSAKGWLDYNEGNYDVAVEEYLVADSLLVAVSGFDKDLYERLLEASERKGDLSARKVALLNLILLKPDDANIKSSLEDIYRLENGTTDGFGEWLTQEVQKNYYRVRLNVPLPDFPLFDVAGNQKNLSEFLGKVVVINFWATWNTSCTDLIPELNKLVDAYQGRNVAFISITNEDTKLVEGFLKMQPFNYGIYFDRIGLAQYLRLENIPIHMVIDRYGKLQYLHVGVMPGIREVLTSEINMLLDD